MLGWDVVQYLGTKDRALSKFCSEVREDIEMGSSSYLSEFQSNVIPHSQRAFNTSLGVLNLRKKRCRTKKWWESVGRVKLEKKRYRTKKW